MMLMLYFHRAHAFFFGHFILFPKTKPCSRLISFNNRHVCTYNKKEEEEVSALLHSTLPTPMLANRFEKKMESYLCLNAVDV